MPVSIIQYVYHNFHSNDKLSSVKHSAPLPLHIFLYLKIIILLSIQSPQCPDHKFIIQEQFLTFESLTLAVFSL